MRTIYTYLNPMYHLGKKDYSVAIPFFSTILCAVILEFYAYYIAHDPHSIDLYAVFLFIALILYNAFRYGLFGGFATAGVTIAYYFYIIYTRHYSGHQLTSGIQTTIVLGILYFFLAGIIGWLKHTIDSLIEQEADEKKRLEAILQQLPVGIMVTDSKGSVTHSNKQLDMILGRKFPAHFVVGKDTLLHATVEGKSVSPSQGPLAQTFTTGKPVAGKEYTIKRKDGKTVYIQMSASVIRNEQGKIIAAAEIITDITQQKEMDKRKDDFVNMASHELKTPITSMKLYIDSLMTRMSQYKDERATKTLAGIKYQTEKLQELVSNLLDVTRIQTGKLSFTRESFHLNELIAETVEGLQQSISTHTLTYSGKNSVVVSADRFRLYQVLTNLITNAAKYSPTGKDIIIRSKKIDGKAIVSIQDFGIGISPDQQKKIFGRLYQVTDAKERTFPGLGMGLYISKEIIKRHKGTIWVESNKGKGATFYFSLPLQKNK